MEYFLLTYYMTFCQCNLSYQSLLGDIEVACKIVLFLLNKLELQSLQRQCIVKPLLLIFLIPDDH